MIICDLGGVVVRIDPSRCHAGWAVASGVPLDVVVERLYPDARYDAYERDEIRDEEYLAHVREQLGTDVDDQTLAACFKDIFIGLDQDVHGLLAAEHRQGRRVVALTNTNRMHHERWSVLYADDLTIFDAVHTSFELRARKPETACFERVLDKYPDVSRSEIVFIDDVIENVEAARSLGMRGIHFTSAEQCARELASGTGSLRRLPRGTGG